MSRDANGAHTLPLAVVVTGTTITSTWANTTMADLSVALSDSLSRSGKGGLTASIPSDVGCTGTVNPEGDTTAGDNAAVGYTAAEGIIITGQGSLNDVTIKNDADADVITIPTGTTTPNFAGDIVMAELADHASTPAAGFGYLWTKSATPSALFFTDDAGTDTEITGTGGGGSTVTVADESSDTTCFPTFAVSAAGTLSLKTGTNLTFNSATGALATTSLTVTGDVGAATGTFTGEVTGTGFTGTLDGILGGGTPAAATVTTLGVNGDITSDADGTDSIGSTGVRFLKGWFDSVESTGTYTGTGIRGVGAAADFDIFNQTSDAADSSSIRINGGGAINNSRGAHVLIYGNEHSSNAGDVLINAGNVAGGNIEFRTASTQLRMTVQNDGDILIANNLEVAGGQVKFPATAVPSADANTLDDYQEIIQTVTLVATTSGTITLNSTLDSLCITKIGRQVFCTGRLLVSSVSSPVGNINISGFPFTLASLTDGAEQFGVPVRAQAMNALADSFVVLEGTSAGATAFRLETMGGATLSSEIIAGTALAVNFFYITDE